VTCSTNSCAGCKSWQFSYHSGIAKTDNFAVTVIWISAAGCITLLLSAGWLGIWELLEKATWNTNRRCHTSVGWIDVTCFTNSCAGCNSWQYHSYHSGTAMTANFAVTVMWISAAGCITLLLSATRQDRQCTSELHCGAFLLKLWGLCFWEVPLKYRFRMGM